MSKPNWACSGCGMYSSRRWSVERHILNLHDGISNVVPFVHYLVGRKSGFYMPCHRPTNGEKSKTSTYTETVMDTFQEEVWKAIATKAANKVLYPSSAGVNQQQYLSNFQGFGSNGALYFHPNQFRLEPSHIIPRPEDIFGFEIYVCKKCSSIEPIIVSFNDGQEGGSKMTWATCCSSSDLKKPKLNDNNELQQKVQDKLKYFVKTWTNDKPMLTAIRILESFHGAIKLLGEDYKQSISLEYSSEKNIELDIDDENHWASR